MKWLIVTGCTACVIFLAPFTILEANSTGQRTSRVEAIPVIIPEYVHFEQGIGWMPTQRIIVTANHIVANTKTTVVVDEHGRSFDVMLLARKPALDLAYFWVLPTSNNLDNRSTLEYLEPTCTEQSNESDVIVIEKNNTGTPTSSMKLGAITSTRSTFNRGLLLLGVDAGPGTSGSPVIRFDGTVAGLVTHDIDQGQLIANDCTMIEDDLRMYDQSLQSIESLLATR